VLRDGLLGDEQRQRDLGAGQPVGGHPRRAGPADGERVHASVDRTAGPRAQRAAWSRSQAIAEGAGSSSLERNAAGPPSRSSRRTPTLLGSGGCGSARHGRVASDVADIDDALHISLPAARKSLVSLTSLTPKIGST
jgi:hypothetical protein